MVIDAYPGFKDIHTRCVSVDGVVHTVHIGTCTDPGLEGESGVFKIDNRAIWRTEPNLRARIIHNALNP